jgi:hypothetical protein
MAVLAFYQGVHSGFRHALSALWYWAGNRNILGLGPDGLGLLLVYALSTSFNGSEPCVLLPLPSLPRDHAAAIDCLRALHQEAEKMNNEAEDVVGDSEAKSSDNIAHRAWTLLIRFFGFFGHDISPTRIVFGAARSDFVAAAIDESRGLERPGAVWWISDPIFPELNLLAEDVCDYTPGFLKFFRKECARAAHMMRNGHVSIKQVSEPDPRRR